VQGVFEIFFNLLVNGYNALLGLSYCPNCLPFFSSCKRSLFVLKCSYKQKTFAFVENPPHTCFFDHNSQAKPLSLLAIFGTGLHDS